MAEDFNNHITVQWLSLPILTSLIPLQMFSKVFPQILFMQIVDSDSVSQEIQLKTTDMEADL